MASFREKCHPIWTEKHTFLPRSARILTRPKGFPLILSAYFFRLHRKIKAKNQLPLPRFRLKTREGRSVFTKFLRSMRRFPIVRRSYFGNERHRQGSDARHQFGDFYLHDVNFVLRHFQNQFVVHLQHEAAL